MAPSILPLGLSTVVMAIWLRTSSSDRPLATSFAGSIWMRIAGFCWPPMNTWATPEIWLICWASCASVVVADLGQRQRVGGRRQQQDRRVGRVDLAVGRRARQVLRQLAAGGIDRGLDVVGGAVDVAVEVELNGDRGRCRANSSRSSARCRESAPTAAPAAGRPRRPWFRGCAPGRLAETWMVGKSTCGSGATGSSG